MLEYAASTSIVVLRTLNKVAEQWVSENCEMEEWQRVGANGWAIDARYADSIARFMHDDELRVEKVRVQ